MKFPSIHSVLTQAARTFSRFYTPLVIAIVGTVVAVLCINNYEKEQPHLLKLIFTCSIGMVLSIGCFLYAERNMGKAGKGIMTSGVLAFMVVYYYFFAPDGSHTQVREWMMFLVLNIALHLWVSFSPYVGKDDMPGFWRFNESLFIRIITTGIFSGVLFGGIALALTAIKVLFGINIQEETYGRLWVCIMGIFNTWFILSGMPERFEELRAEKAFPKGLKIFSQYILIPLATLYMVILYVYGAKIIAEWNLPQGWVSMLILTYSVVGVLAILLVTPLRDDKDNAWVRLFSRFFFIALLPLIVLLYVAVGARVRQYGITEPRYYLIILGAWLAFISLYYIFSKKKNIKLIPITLSVIGLLTLWGPWSAFSVSVRSQVNRFEALLTKNKLLDEKGRIAAGRKVTAIEGEELREIIDYLLERNEQMKLQPFYNTDIVKLQQRIHNDTSREPNIWEEQATLEDSLIAELNIQAKIHERYQNYERREDITDIRGYSLMHNLRYYQHTATATDDSFKKEGVYIKFRITQENGMSKLLLNNSGDTGIIDMGRLVQKVVRSTDENPVAANEMIFYSGDSSYKLIITELRPEYSDSSYRYIEYLEAQLLVK